MEGVTDYVTFYNEGQKQVCYERLIEYDIDCPWSVGRSYLLMDLACIYLYNYAFCCSWDWTCINSLYTVYVLVHINYTVAVSSLLRVSTVVVHITCVMYCTGGD